jgi:hypothetical protein
MERIASRRFLCRTYVIVLVILVSGCAAPMFDA